MLPIIAASAAQKSGEVIQQHLQSKQEEREALLSAAQDNQEVAAHLEAAEKQRTRRTALRLGAGLLAFGIAAGAVSYALVEGPAKAMQGIHNLWHDLESATPKPEMSARINSALHSVSLPDTLPLVQGDGTSSAKITVEDKSNMPVVGAIFNWALSSHTKQTATVKRDESVQVTMSGSALQLNAYQITPNAGNNISGSSAPQTKQKVQWGVEVDVPSDAFTTQLLNPHDAIGPDKRIEAHSTTSKLNIIFGSDSGFANGATIEQAADDHFENSCAPFLTPVLSAGIQNYVHQFLIGASRLETSLGQTDNAKLLDMVAQQPINVIFQKEQQTGPAHSKFTTVDVAPTDIHLLTVPEPTNTQIARELGDDPSQVSIETGNDCTATVAAVSDMTNLLQPAHSK